jgi:3-hydroxyisobutyrate dehydrogenase
MSESQPIAVLGAGGIMGLPMAKNASIAGLEVRGWNRTREKAEPLEDSKATVADSPADAAKDAAVVVTVLADIDAVLESVSEAFPAMADDAVWIQMSTVGIEGIERCAEVAEEAGVTLVDAPVSGTKLPAEKGELIVLASGPDSAKDACAPFFGAVGKRTIWAGDTGAGTRLKLVTNSWVLSLVESLAETIALAEGLDVDPAAFLDVIEGGPMDSGYAQLKGKAMIDREFEPSFKLALAAKDARLVSEAAERHDLELPLLAAVRDRLAEGVDEHGDEDMAATFATSAKS